MKRFISPLSIASLAFLLSACSYQGSYRYPCQDPANWDSAECKPPVCTVNGACPEDLVGDAYNQDSPTNDSIVEEPLPAEGE